MSISDSLPDETEGNSRGSSQGDYLQSQINFNKRLNKQENLRQPQLSVDAPLRMVETAFLASTASLIWYINYYFPLGLLRMFFPIPIALVYLRWGKRASWISAVVSGLLLLVLMGPIRSLLFMIPYGFMGILLGVTWNRRVPWMVSISLGTILGALGTFFRLWFLSLFAGQDLWIYTITQVTNLIEWLFLKLGILATPSAWMIQIGVIGLIMISQLVYLFVVHIAAWLLLDRLGNPIPRPPRWVQIMMEYE